MVPARRDHEKLPGPDLHQLQTDLTWGGGTGRRDEITTISPAVQVRDISLGNYFAAETFAGPSHLTESGELECLAIESRGRAATQSAIACVDQTISEIGGRAFPQVNRFFYGRLILKCEFCSVQ